MVVVNLSYYDVSVVPIIIVFLSAIDLGRRCVTMTLFVNVTEDDRGVGLHILTISARKIYKTIISLLLQAG